MFHTGQSLSTPQKREIYTLHSLHGPYSYLGEVTKHSYKCDFSHVMHVQAKEEAKWEDDERERATRLLNGAAV